MFSVLFMAIPDCFCDKGRGTICKKTAQVRSFQKNKKYAFVGNRPFASSGVPSNKAIRKQLFFLREKEKDTKYSFKCVFPKTRNPVRAF